MITNDVHDITSAATLKSSLSSKYACDVRPRHSTAAVPVKSPEAVTALVLEGITSTIQILLMLLLQTPLLRRRRALSHLARNAPVAIRCPMAAEPQAGVNTVHYERLLHVLRLIMWG